MATQEQIIDRVRRRVADYNETRRYGDDHYDDAIIFALSKLNHDFDESYTQASDVPATRVFLLVKLATIEMAYIRASESAEGDSGDGDQTRFSTLAVPDLSVRDESAGETRGAGYWLKLASDLQSEYDTEVGSSAGQNQGGMVEVAYSQRVGLRHGGYIKRNIDEGLPAVTVDDPPTVDGSDVLISWSKLRREDFSYYEVTRSSSAIFASETVVRQETDIHVIEYIDEDVSAGTWYYRVKSVNPNHIKINSNSVSAVVV